MILLHRPFQKIVFTIHSLIPWFISFGLIFCVNQLILAGEITFHVPPEHEKFALVDSLFTAMNETEKKKKTLERKIFVRDKSIIKEKMSVKAKYFDYLLEHKLMDATKVYDFTIFLKDYYELKMTYFHELLSTQEGDIRSKCFLLWKRARQEFTEVNDIVLKYKTRQAEQQNSQIAKEEERATISGYDSYNDPDLLGNLDSLDNGDPFANVKNTKIEIKRE